MKESNKNRHSSADQRARERLAQIAREEGKHGSPVGRVGRTGAPPASD
jgi:hypothetical protein